MTLTIFFGVGGSAEAYVQNTGELPDFFSDNDANKWGTVFFGREILRPTILRSLDINKVVMTTSYVSEVVPQLLAVGIEQEQIIVPPKSAWSLRPFASPLVREQSIRLVEELQQSGCARHPIVVVGGGCLGLHRDGDLIPWDDDIDFRADERDFYRILRHLEATSASPRVEEGERRSIVGSWNVKNHTVNFSITFYDGKTSSHIDRFDKFEWTWPREMFRNPFVAAIGDACVLLPNPPSAYLEAVYGSDWFVPRESFSVLDYQGRTSQNSD